MPAKKAGDFRPLMLMFGGIILFSSLPARRRQLIIRNPHLRVRMSGLSARTLEPPSLYVGTRGTQLSLRLASPLLPAPTATLSPEAFSVRAPLTV